MVRARCRQGLAAPQRQGRGDHVTLGERSRVRRAAGRGSPPGRRRNRDQGGPPRGLDRPRQRRIGRWRDGADDERARRRADQRVGHLTGECRPAEERDDGQPDRAYPYRNCHRLRIRRPVRQLRQPSAGHRQPRGPDDLARQGRELSAGRPHDVASARCGPLPPGNDLPLRYASRSSRRSPPASPKVDRRARLTGCLHAHSLPAPEQKERDMSSLSSPPRTGDSYLVMADLTTLRVTSA